MLHDYDYEADFSTGDASITTKSFHGYLEHVMIACKEKKNVQIFYKGLFDLLLFDGWVTPDAYIPLRIMPINDENLRMNYEGVRVALKGKLVFIFTGDNEAKVTISVMIDEAD